MHEALMQHSGCMHTTGGALVPDACDAKHTGPATNSMAAGGEVPLPRFLAADHARLCTVERIGWCGSRRGDAARGDALMAVPGWLDPGGAAGRQELLLPRIPPADLLLLLLLAPHLMLSLKTLLHHVSRDLLGS